jgi:thioredoxin reductase (NADPH)
MSGIYDLLIIGGGPAGLSAAFAAKRHGLDYLVLERGQIASTIRNYPVGKPLFSTSNELEFEPGALRSSGSKPTREELLDYYQRFAEQEQRLNIKTQETVEAILPGDPPRPLEVVTGRARYRARAVLMAVGGMGIFNRLDVPGETADRVSYLFREGKPFSGKKVLVVGGGNSAAEATLYLNESGAKVTLLLRRPGLGPSQNPTGSAIKPWVMQPLEASIDNGLIRAFFSARVIEIYSKSALVEANGERHEIESDHIFALIGARPDISLLAAAGAAIGPDKRPEYDRETYETTIANLYVAGHLTRELHMKHAITIPPEIVARIAMKMKR